MRQFHSLAFSFVHCLFGLLGLLLGSACNSDVEEVTSIENADRTILIYMIGDNSLSSYCDRNIREMIKGMDKIHSTGHLLVYEDSNDGHLPTLWKIERDDGDSIVVKVEMEYAEQNSSDTKILKSIVDYTFNQYPAKEKGVIFWSHGNGWLPARSCGSNAPRERTLGPDTTDYLEIWDLRAALEMTQFHFDFIFFDACLMASVEVVYEMKDLADNFLVSPTEIMGYGFPYADMVPCLMRERIDYDELCRIYMNFYNGTSLVRSGSISWIQSLYLEELAQTYREIIRSQSITRAQVLDYQIQQFGRLVYSVNGSITDYSNLFFDLSDWITHLSSSSASAISTALSKVVKKTSFTRQFGMTVNGGVVLDIYRSSGLTVFIPEVCTNESYLQAYQLLRWYQTIYN